MKKKQGDGYVLRAAMSGAISRTLRRLTLLGLIMAIGFFENVYGYIGPGPGFVLVSSLLALLSALLLFLFSLFLWPFRVLSAALFRRRRRPRPKGNIERVIVIGMDGMDPRLTEKFIASGRLPNFAKLKQEGVFTTLSTTYPSLSPVAWSTFTTGVDPSHHNIFDFITRDPCTYQPVLSSAEIGRASKILALGKYRIPLAGARMKGLRKSQPFWKILGENGVFSSVIRVPVTFPPEKFHGVLLSGMCTPDLRGSQGTFSYYTTSEEKGVEVGGVRYTVRLQEDFIRTFLHGPENTLVEGGSRLKLPLSIRVNQQTQRVRIEVSDQKFDLGLRIYSPWIPVTFRPGLGFRIHGICRFYVNRISPHFELYVTPIHIDPEKPAFPISHPSLYSVYLAKLLGPYGTLGLAEDTWALNEGVIDEDAFLKQAYLFFEERQKMFFEALKKTRRGLCVCVFDTTDRVQHMFFRCLEEDHPANRGKEVQKYRNVIEDLYRSMDRLLGRALEEVDENTLLMVISDHGFCSFRRGVNLNTWLHQNGYLALEEGRKTCGNWFEGVDWAATRAFSLGLTGIFINRSGREIGGTVDDGDKLQQLKKELVQKLTGLVDVETGQKAILRVVDTESWFSGPYLYDAPDLIIGYNSGYRASWEAATGRVTDKIIEDNTRRWSGDHCVDPELVPGIFFSNRKINTDRPGIQDIAPTLLSVFGLEVPSYIKGKQLI